MKHDSDDQTESAQKLFDKAQEVIEKLEGTKSPQVSCMQNV
jgi:hypothetical protein